MYGSPVAYLEEQIIVLHAFSYPVSTYLGIYPITSSLHEILKGLFLEIKTTAVGRGQLHPCLLAPHNRDASESMLQKYCTRQLEDLY